MLTRPPGCPLPGKLCWVQGSAGSRRKFKRSLGNREMAGRPAHQQPWPRGGRASPLLAPTEWERCDLRWPGPFPAGNCLGFWECAALNWWPLDSETLSWLTPKAGPLWETSGDEITDALWKILLKWGGEGSALPRMQGLVDWGDLLFLQGLTSVPCRLVHRVCEATGSRSWGINECRKQEMGVLIFFTLYWDNRHEEKISEWFADCWEGEQGLVASPGVKALSSTFSQDAPVLPSPQALASPLPPTLKRCPLPCSWRTSTQLASFCASYKSNNVTDAFVLVYLFIFKDLSFERQIFF